MRARDRFGNETANVASSGVGFTVEMQVCASSAFSRLLPPFVTFVCSRLQAVAPSDDGAANDASSSSPAMRKRLGSIAGGGGSPLQLIGGSSSTADQAPTLGRLDSCEGRWLDGGLYEITYVPATRGVFEVHVVCIREVDGADKPERSSVPSFFPLPVEVSPLGPDAQKSVLVNAHRYALLHLQPAPAVRTPSHAFEPPHLQSAPAHMP
mgnify:CR=1 FL=1